MAMTLPISPASDGPQPASPTTTANSSGGSGNNNNASSTNSLSAASNNSNNNHNSNSNNANDNSSNSNNAREGSSGPNPNPNVSSGAAASGASGGAQMKRKPSRRANTAERRATHNAVERQRRETLNGRFLDLAALLPNLSQIRRPSKSSIVNSSIAHIHASRRHRLLASAQLRTLKNEADALRREINEWRDRAGIPRIEEPVRGEAFSMVLSGELELVGVVGEEEDGEDGVGADDDGFGASGGQYMEGVEDNDMIPMSAGAYSPQQHMHHPHQVAMHPQMQHHIQQQQHHAQQMYGNGGHPGHHMEDLDDPRIAAMLMKNGGAGAQNPFAHNMPAQHHQQRADYFGGYRQGNGAGYGSHPSQGPFSAQGQLQGQQHLFTPPATAHGLPPSAALNRSSAASTTHSNGSHAGSPSPVADGLSPHLSVNTSSLNGPSNGSVHGSPVSTSSLDGGLMVPPNTAVSPVGLTGAAAFEARGSVSPSQTQVKPGQGRGRSGSVLSVGSGGASPSYELAHGYDVGLSVPRRMEGAGGYMMNGIGLGGMNGMPGMTSGMHPGYGGHGSHHAHGGMQHGGMAMGGGNGMGANMMGVGVGGGNNGNAMMMMMM